MLETVASVGLTPFKLTTTLVTFDLKRKCARRDDPQWS